MKFSDGNWLLREGFNLHSPAEAYDCITEDNGLTVYAPSSQVYNRACTLGGPMFTYRITAPMPDVLRVQIVHFKGGKAKGPIFEILEEDHAAFSVTEMDGFIHVTSGNLTARIKKGAPWSLEFLRNGEPVTSSMSRDFAYVTGSDGKTHMREQLNLGVGECIYGLGERFSPFVKNGQTIDTWNRDGGTGTEQVYKAIPFYMSSRGYGVFVNDPGNVTFEIASEKVSKVGFCVEGESLDYFVIDGPDPKDVLRKYTALTGRPSLPPAWSFGLWLTTSFVTNYDEATVNSFIDGMAERELPLHVFHFDCFWMREFNWCDFKWDPRVFPEPEAMLRRLKEKGLKVCVWINPYIAQRSPLFDEGMENGYLLKRPDGSVWQWDLWQPGMGVVDFTNPGACEWFAGKIKGLVAMGVDCIKTDFGERIPTDVAYHDGSDPEKMHNYYSYLYNKVVFDALEESLGKGQAVLFARSASVGSQKFPVHWGGDCSANYPSMAESLRGGLSLCLSGFGFWSHDISGFEHTATPDLYKRWAAFGLLSTHSRLHGNHSYRVPWNFDEEAVDVVRYFTKLKCKLMPYIFGKAVEATTQGIPVMRAMLLEFPKDPGCKYLDTQYMLGDSLLVAPIFSDDGTVEYYLPEGVWTDIVTGETVTGGGWRKEIHGYMSLPLLARPSSIIPMGAVDDRPDYDHAKDTVFHIFNLEDGKCATGSVHALDGNLSRGITAERKGDRIFIMRTGVSAEPITILLRNVENITAVDGGSFESTPLGIRVKALPGSDNLNINL